MLSRATFPTSVFRLAHPNSPLPSAHGPSAPLSNIHRLFSVQPALRSSFWPFAKPKAIGHRIIEASNRYSDLSDRHLLLLFLSKQDVIWEKQAKRIRKINLFICAAGAILVGIGCRVYLYSRPQLEAWVEEAAKKEDQNWKTVGMNQRHIFNKLVEIEKRLEK